MKVLLLAAGYGTRLEKACLADKTGKYGHLVGVPKPLIPLDGKPLASYWMTDLRACPDVDCKKDVYIVTNDRFHDVFVKWAKEEGFPAENIINDGSKDNASRVGAIADMALAIEKMGKEDDVMVIGGDTLFMEDFDLSDCIKKFNTKKTSGGAAFQNQVLWYTVEETRDTGILVTNEADIVTDFLEKPEPEATPSRKACPCFYLYSKESLSLFETYVAQCKSQFERDAPGRFLEWVHSRSPTTVYEISGRWDIGGLPSYIEANDYFVSKKGGSKRAREESDKMKVLILAAGYGTRLEKACLADKTGKYGHLVGVPKPLIPLDGKPLASYWMDDLRACPQVDCKKDVYFVANARFYDAFVKWAKEEDFPVENIINDGSKDNATRVGAIADMALAVEKMGKEDDVMVIGGDTLFMEDFDLSDCIETFKKKKTSSGAAFQNQVLWYNVEETRDTGILVTNEAGIVTDFLEKPEPEATPSRKACPCFYLYSKESLSLFDTYVAQCKTQFQRDAPGRFLEWVHSRSPTTVYEISGRWDIGGLPSYIEANDYFVSKKGGQGKEPSTGNKKQKTSAGAATEEEEKSPSLKLVFIRHGNAEHNAGFDKEGESAYFSAKYRYSKLTEKGHKQTNAIDLKGVVADVVFCSPLIRCIETARNVFGPKPKLFLHDGLMETQGEHPCNHRASRSEILAAQGPSNVDVEKVSEEYDSAAVMKNPENWVRLQERAQKSLAEIVETARIANADRIAIVTHNDWLQAVFNRKFVNAEVCQTTLDQIKWESVTGRADPQRGF